jgi:hypothetical protein
VSPPKSQGELFGKFSFSSFMLSTEQRKVLEFAVVLVARRVFRVLGRITDAGFAERWPVLRGHATKGMTPFAGETSYQSTQVTSGNHINDDNTCTSVAILINLKSKRNQILSPELFPPLSK